jgi:hypothetical protein
MCPQIRFPSTEQTSSRQPTVPSTTLQTRRGLRLDLRHQCLPEDRSGVSGKNSRKFRTLGFEIGNFQKLNFINFFRTQKSFFIPLIKIHTKQFFFVPLNFFYYPDFIFSYLHVRFFIPQHYFFEPSVLFHTVYTYLYIDIFEFFIPILKFHTIIIFSYQCFFFIP